MKSCKGKLVLCILVCLVVILRARTTFAAIVSIPTGLEGIMDTTVMVPVNINEAVPLSAYNLEVGYDPDVLDFVGLLPIAVSEKDLPGGVGSADEYFYYSDDAYAGEVRIGVVNFYPVAKAGVLMYLKFTVLTVAMDSPLTILIVSDPGNDLSGVLTSAGSITTSTTEPAGKCQIRAVMTTVPGEVLVNLKAEGVGITQSYSWTWGDDPDVVFIVDPGTYQIVAQSVGYATYYSSDLDCYQDFTDVVINTLHKPSYTVTRKDFGPNNPKVKLTFRLLDYEGDPLPWPVQYPLDLSFYNSANDANGDGKPDTALLDPDGPTVNMTVPDASGNYVVTVDLSDADFILADWTGANQRLDYDAYVIAFRTKRGAGFTTGAYPGDTEFLLDSEVRVHRYIVRAVYSEETRAVSDNKSTFNLKEEMATKGFINIQMDTNSVNDPAIFNIVQDTIDAGTTSLDLEFDMGFADISLFTSAADPGTPIDPNTDLEITVEYHTGVGAGLTTASPGVYDPSDMIVVSIDFTDPATGETIVYNPDMSDNVPLLYFDIPLPGALQDPNLFIGEIMENKLITTTAHRFWPGRYGLYFITSGSNEPQLFIPGDNGSICVFMQNGVFMATIGTPHASLWYIGGGPKSIPEPSGDIERPSAGWLFYPYSYWSHDELTQYMSYQYPMMDDQLHQSQILQLHQYLYTSFFNQYQQRAWYQQLYYKLPFKQQSWIPLVQEHKLWQLPQTNWYNQQYLYSSYFPQSFYKKSVERSMPQGDFGFQFHQQFNLYTRQQEWYRKFSP